MRQEQRSVPNGMAKVPNYDLRIMPKANSKQSMNIKNHNSTSTIYSRDIEIILVPRSLIISKSSM
ncbi:hypothetical protein LR48_Vigan2341s000100 [Vigna angularis]|nr:hypothetical protein LR48_Vigan2341s000100 [Vigna angularis]